MPSRFSQKELIFIATLAVVQFTHIVDFMIVMPLGKQFMSEFEINPQQFSNIVSSYAYSAAIFGLIGSLFIDRFDRKRALFFLYIGFTVGTLMCAVVPTYSTFLMARCLTGAFGGLLVGLVLAIIGDSFEYERRATATGMILTAFSVASVVGVPSGLFIAARLGTRAPFFLLGITSIFVCLLIWMVVPPLRAHLDSGKVERNALKIWGNILKDKNQLLALTFTIVLMLGHFTIIPFIAPYMQFNIGFTDDEVALIYLIGGSFTAVLLPAVGVLADRMGNAIVFSISSILALFSIYFLTNLQADISLFWALVATSSLFIVSSGRSVPATTMVASVVKPESRASFMTVRTSANNMALGLGSTLAGAIVIENVDGSLGKYEQVGYVAMAMSIVAIWLMWKLRAVD